MIRKKIFVLLAIFLSVQSIDNLNAQSCYELVWNDEFNYNGLPDSTKWYFEEGGTGWGNNELQYYTSKRIENAYVENGYLTIEARKEDYNGKDYTSARLITYPNGHSWKYGKIEARIKLPYGQGIWPAFWMLGDGIFEGTPWPGCGEIDIMEMVGGGEGKDDVIYGTMHYDDNGHAEYGDSYQLSEGIFADDFHVFSIEWTQTQLKWYVDGIKYHEASLIPSYLSEFQKEFFILLNIAVGGNWPGNPDGSTVFPQKMMVDYVRVYQLDNQPEITGFDLVNKAQKNVTYSTVESEDFSYNWTVPSGATITGGQGTSSISVNWGCADGDVTCQLTTNCSTYNLTKNIQAQPIEITGQEKIEPSSENLSYSISELDATNYTWEVPNDAEFVGDSDTNVVFVNWGSESGYVIVSAETNCGDQHDSIYVEAIKQLPYPDPNSKHKIPGTIEAIDYDTGGEGIAYHDADVENQGTGLRQDEGVDTEYNDGGQNIGWIKSGEWVEYSVDVESSGPHDIELRVASLNGGGQMEIYFSNENRTGIIDIPSTGSWTSFTSIYLSDIQLYDTDTLMKLNFVVGDFNISRLIFGNETTSKTDLYNPTNAIGLFPNPASDIIYLSNHLVEFEYSIISLLGNVVQRGVISPGMSIDISNINPGTYYLQLVNKNQVITLKFIKL
ncbi:MAG: family 16 glycosylhydrolase [Bacteroidetes bacterium]|nr:family 16 glycosylhydrolase [Bacteroidota bacterium]